jgi:putative oxidoreductase
VSTAVDLGTFIIRLALGPMLILHGYNKLFGAGGLAGTTRWFEGLGLRPAWLHARLAPVNEIGAGILMTLGLFFPLAAAAFVGLMAVASFTDHQGKGYFVFKGGWEYTLLVGMVAVGMASIGPGDWSVDHALLDWHLEGVWWAAFAAVVGLAVAGLLMVTSYRPVKKSDTAAV